MVNAVDRSTECGTTDLPELWLDPYANDDEIVRRVAPLLLKAHALGDKSIPALSESWAAMRTALKGLRGAEAREQIKATVDALASAGQARAQWLAEAALAIQACRDPQSRQQMLPRLLAHDDDSLAPRGPVNTRREAVERACTHWAISVLLTLDQQRDDALHHGLLAWELLDPGLCRPLRWHVGSSLAGLFLNVGDVEVAQEILNRIMRESTDMGRQGIAAYFQRLLMLLVGSKWTEASALLRQQPWMRHADAQADMPGLAEMVLLVDLHEDAGTPKTIPPEAPMPSWAEGSWLLRATRGWVRAQLFLAIEQPAQALQALDQLNLAAHTSGVTVDALSRTQIHKAQSDAYEALGLMPQALDALRKSQAACVTWVGESVRSRLKLLHSMALQPDANAQNVREEVLRRAVEEATSALSQDRHRLQQQERFISHVAHELRSPAAGIVGLSSLLMMSDLAERDRHRVNLMHGAAQMLSALCNDILEIAKMSAGQFELRPTPQDFSALVRETCELWRPMLVAKGVSLVYTIDQDTPSPLIVDRLRMQQVLMNLMSNATKFTRRGKIVVKTAWTPPATPGAGRITVSVADTGIGIAAEHLPRLFNEFVQADSSIAEDFGGTGLGLALCRNLIRRMGGDIGAESQPGVGSVFSFTVPLSTSTSDAPLPKDQTSAAGHSLLA